ncbi:MAG: PaaX family transcriptional regulator [Ktedonobacteraceae bacterium]|nr:PaaX family transcriptional regulator [Ktedonobacteraceae bacterium]
MNVERTHIKAQHLLITVLGDYWWCRPEPLPSTGLIRVLAEFGVGSDGTRSALSRLTRRGLLERSQQGRNTYYILTRQAIQMLQVGAERLFDFGAEEQPWDGNWSLVAFSISEQERTLRHFLRTRLRWLTFGSLYDGLWISPHPRLAAAARLLDELGISTATLFSARMLPRSTNGNGEDWLRVWDLESLCQQYEAYIRQVQPLLLRVREGRVEPPEAMLARPHVMDAWRAFPGQDPDLPAEFLPADWPRNTARSICMEVYETLRPAAEQRFNELIETRYEILQE